MSRGRLIFAKGVEHDYSWDIGVQLRIAKERKLGVSSQYQLISPGDSEKHIENQIFAIYAAINKVEPDFTLAQCEKMLSDTECDSKVLQLIFSEMLQTVPEVWQPKWVAVQETALQTTKDQLKMSGAME